MALCLMRKEMVGTLIVMLALGFAAGVLAQVDPSTHYQIIPNPRPGFPEEAICLDATLSCYLQTLICSKDCPQRGTTGSPACWIDCVECTTVCKNRVPNCFGFGAVCYDPRFIGGDGIMFYFHGKKDEDFCLVSDRNLHINAHFIGKRPEGRPRDYTWVQGLGLLWDSHKLSISAKKVGIWDDNVDQLTFSLDGNAFSVPNENGGRWTLAELTVQRTSEVNRVHVTIDQLMEVSLSVVPITMEDSRVHNYQITEDNCFAHLHMQFTFTNLSPNVHGVLGQTYQPDFKNPVNSKLPMPVMRGDETYFSSSLFSPDCRVTQFFTGSINPKVESIPEDTLNSISSVPVHCSNSARGIMSCRR